MKQLVSATRSRLALAVLAAGMAIAATIVLASPSEAAGPSNCTYYDWSRTTVVGRFGKDCCNNKVAWGVKTAYAECSTACLLCVPPPRD